MDLACHHAKFEPLFELRAGAEAEVERIVERQLRDPDSVVWVADAGNALAGFCAVRIDRAPPIHEEDQRAEITDLFVSALHRRSGVGRALVEEALGWVQQRGVERVAVRVATRNDPGQGFWRALGFVDFMDVLHRRL